LGAIRREEALGKLIAAPSTYRPARLSGIFNVIHNMMEKAATVFMAALCEAQNSAQ
jgi:hypothetical protein